MSAGGAERKPERLAALAVSCILAIAYCSTAAPCAWWGDGLELASASWTLGIAHPPGYPLYTVLGHFWMRIFGAYGDPGRALTLFSAACLTIAGGVQTLLFASAAREPLIVKGGRTADVHSGAIAGALAALAIGLSRTVWEHATFAEVYPLTYLLGTLAVAWCWRWREDTTGVWREDTRGPWREEGVNAKSAAALGILTGLLAINHYSGAAIGPLAAICALNWADRNRARRKSTIFAAAGVFMTIFLLGFAYLPLRAQANPPLNWGDPSSLGRFFWQVRGGQFAQFKVGGGIAASLAGLCKWLDWWGSQWLPGTHGFPAEPQAIANGFLDRTLLPGSRWPQMLIGMALLAAACGGLLDLARTRRGLASGLLASIGMTGFFAGFYHIVDIDAFFLIALPAAGVGWIVAARRFALALRRLGSRLLKGDVLQGLGAAALAMLALADWHWIDKSGDTAPLEWGRKALGGVPSGGLIVTAGDNDIYALWYQQMVLKRRPDVSVIGSNFIGSGWYRRYFERPDRPRVDVGIVDRAIPPDKPTFDAQLIAGTFLPALKAGKGILLTFEDPAYANLFHAEQSAPLLPEEYYAWAFARSQEGLPSPFLYKLHSEPALEGMDEDGLRGLMSGLYARNNAGPAGGRP